MANVLWMGKAGQTILVDTNIPLSGTVVAVLQVKMPDGTFAAWPATVSNPTSGQLSYTTNGTSDVTEVGEYVIQANVTLNSVQLPPGKKGYFRVQQAIY
jgi:hypothetical protein